MLSVFQRLFAKTIGLLEESGISSSPVSTSLPWEGRRQVTGGAESISGKNNLRFLVVDNKADKVSIVARTVALPGKFDPCAARAVGLKLQDGASTCGETSPHSSI